LEAVYGKTLNTVEHDVHAWMQSARSAPAVMPSVVAGSVKVEVAEMTPLAAHMALAEVLFDAGELDRAAAMYAALSVNAPHESAIAAALGAIALRRGDREGARREWRRALDGGLADASLCYRYAVLAEDAGLSAAEIRPALERAVMLRPDFEDARYTLALLEMNAGNYERAVTQFRGMKTIASARRYGYWSGLGYCLNEIGRREEAKAAAQHAALYASTPEERERAQQIAYIADTDMTVRFTRDPQGRAQMETTRTRHGDTNWNPFVEPTDRMRRIEGALREIRCGAGATRFVVASPERELTLSIADPAKVLMRNAPAEFTCGPQKPPAQVKVDYAAAVDPSEGVIRGVEFLVTSPRIVESQSRGQSQHPR
jgi:Flp pilus assembly protein TadD